MTVMKEAPAGAVVLDLDRARAARAEARAAAGESRPVLKLTGGFVEVAAEFDVLCAEDFAGGHIRAGLSKLLADPADIDAVIAGGISKDDLESIVTFVTGATPGE